LKASLPVHERRSVRVTIAKRRGARCRREPADRDRHDGDADTDQRDEQERPVARDEPEVLKAIAFA